MATNEAELKAAPGDFSLLGLLIVLARRKLLLLGLPFGVAVLAAGVSMLLPSEFAASAKLLPPQQAQSSAAAVLSQLGGFAGAAGAAGLKNPSDVYVGMLKSRTLADKLIVKHDLKAAYETDSMEKARRRLEANTTISSGKDGLISIVVLDRDQKRVAPIANGYVSELIALTKVLALTEAAQRRVFYERQLEGAKDNLASAEVTLKQALDTRGVISVDADSRVIVEVIGRLRAQISAKEIELGAMRAFATGDNPEVVRARQGLASLRAELSKLENGRPAPDGQGAPSSQVGLENIKVLRDVKYYQMLYELLAKQYEVARLDEAKEVSIIQVLDSAVEPERKVGPKRALIVIVSALLALLATMAWIILSAARQDAMRVPAQAAQWHLLRSHLGFR